MTNANHRRPRFIAAAAAAVALGATAMTAAAASAAQAAPAAAAAQPVKYGFYTFNDKADPTFNQLLGINNKGLIAGYFGSGAQGHPNKGYLLAPPWQGSYASENFPGSVQTQVTGLNDKGDTVGFWSSMNNANQINDNFGFYRLKNGAFHTVRFPTGDNANPPVDQLLGINNHDVAVGFYVNGQGSDRGFTYDIKKKKFARVQVPGAPGGTAAPSLTAAAINNHGDVAGFWVSPATGKTDAFLSKNGTFTDFAFPGAASTQALGLNDSDELVGTYVDRQNLMHGFTWRAHGGFQAVDDPHGVGTTTINGVNNAGDLVGFYTDAAGNTDGFMAEVKTTVKVNLTGMPQGKVITRTVSGQPEVAVGAFGLTPGSAHAVLLKGKPIGTLTANGSGSAITAFNVSGVPSGSRVKILDGGVGTKAIAQSGPLSGKGSFKLHPLEAGFPQGTLQGHATIVYDPAGNTISVTLDASGVSRGMHAAHIHVGSCVVQGPVQYMLMDFKANGQGKINHETRKVAASVVPLAPSGWYLNLHQGNSNNILSNGNPTMLFRPLLCANI